MPGTPYTDTYSFSPDGGKNMTTPGADVATE